MELNTCVYFVDFENNTLQIITGRINFMKLEELALWWHLFPDEAAENHTLWHRTHSLSTEQRTDVGSRPIVIGRQYPFLMPHPTLVKECTTDIPVIQCGMIPFMWGVPLWSTGQGTSPNLIADLTTRLLLSLLCAKFVLQWFKKGRLVNRPCLFSLTQHKSI